MVTDKLDLIEIGKIKGDFIVEDYQRGYRWGATEVECLLDDIYTAIRDDKSKTYCLQPIVVKKRENDVYELVDGQQRLTTIYIIYKCMFEITGGIVKMPNVTINYVTRTSSKEYLNTLDPEHSEDYIDFYYMYDAYKTVKRWLDNKSDNENELPIIAMDISAAFLRQVKVIWYEVDSSENSEKLFARLNIGRIPLTCAELTKAMFLSNMGKLSEQQKNEIALQWDIIECDLHENSIWSFLTEESVHEDSTRIELVLDLMANKTDKERDKLYTFLQFSERQKRGENLWKIWQDINRTFLLLKSWYRDDELYHKIGYLIATGSKIEEIFELSKGKTKTEFKSKLDEKIKAGLKADKNYGEMLYTSSSDCVHISKLLFLFNVISVYARHGRFPFDKFKDRGKAKWSLEHIHAQHSEGLSTVKEWSTWIQEHIKPLECLGDEHDMPLIDKMKEAAASEKLTETQFKDIHDRVVQRLSPEGETFTRHNISNLALLNTRDNAELNNATFAAKRIKIIEKEDKGDYIPFCTKMVFLKYYSPDAKHMYYWSEEDRIAYVQKINDIMYDTYKYLKEKIVIETEDAE